MRKIVRVREIGPVGGDVIGLSETFHCQQAPSYFINGHVSTIVTRGLPLFAFTDT